eukprot:2129485-Rhodomonas_salina.1
MVRSMGGRRIVTSFLQWQAMIQSKLELNSQGRHCETLAPSPTPGCPENASPRAPTEWRMPLPAQHEQ